MINTIKKLIASGVITTANYVDTAVKASQTITSTGVQVTDNDTVTIGNKTYRFKNTPTQANDVKIGANAAASLSNLKSALAGGGDGTLFFPGTLAHTQVDGDTLTATTLLVWAKTAGVAGNAIGTTDSAATLSWGAATLTGGIDSSTFEVDRSVLGSLVGSGQNQIVFLLKANSTGDTLTVRPEQLFNIDNNNDQAEDIGWVPVMEDGTYPAMRVYERTLTGELYYVVSFKTIADRVRLKVKGVSVVSAWFAAGTTEA